MAEIIDKEKENTTAQTDLDLRAVLDEEDFPDETSGPIIKRNLALVIGIDAYSLEKGCPPLKTAVNDARKLAEVLTEKYDYQVTTLLDEQASLEGMTAALDREAPGSWASQVQPDDQVLFYFAGHGLALKEEDGPTGYFIPQSGHAGRPDTYLAMKAVHDALAALDCFHCLVILDCCYSGAFRWSGTRNIFSPPEPTLYWEAYQRFSNSPAWQVLTSAAYDEKALDSVAGTGFGQREADNADHSPFAQALLAALRDETEDGRKADANSDGVLIATELYLYLRDNVQITAKQTINHNQTPGIWPLAKHEKGEYIFLLGDPNDLPKAPEPDETMNPYRGLESYNYNEADANLFFGRTTLIRQLAATTEKYPFTMVLGVSGTGKSSLVKAGLLPRLKQLDADVDTDNNNRKSKIQNQESDWFIPLLPDEKGKPSQPIRPGEYPLRELQRWMDTFLPQTPTEAELRTNPAALATALAAWQPEQPGQKLLLVIDQFEELITLCQRPWEREQFLQLLLEAGQAHSGQFRLIVTLRSDFEPQITAMLEKQANQYEAITINTEPPEATNGFGSELRSPSTATPTLARFFVPLMTPTELRAVIEKPAAQKVLFFEPPELVETIITEVGRTPGALPLLSFTLSQLYLRYLARFKADAIAAGRNLTGEDYEDLGGVIGSLRKRANEEYEALDEAGKATMRRVMLRMVSIEGGEITRRKVPLNELKYSDSAEKERVETILNRLTHPDVRLLVRGTFEQADGTDAPYVEPAHDELVRAWKQLQDWIRESIASLPLQRELNRNAIVWFNEADQDKKRNYLWHNNPNLPRLEEIVTGQVPSQDPNLFTRLWQRVATLWQGTKLTAIDDHWLNELELNFVQASVERRQRDARQLVWTILGVMAVLVVLVAIAFVQRNIAVSAGNAQATAEATAVQAAATAVSSEATSVSSEATAASSGATAVSSEATSVSSEATALSSGATAVASEGTAVASEATAVVDRENAVNSAATAVASEATAEAEAVARATAEATAVQAASTAESAEATAIAERDIARSRLSRQLVSQSSEQLSLDNDGTLPFLLAIEAGKSADTKESFNILRDNFAREGRVIKEFYGHSEWVRQAIWNSDYTRLLTASNDGTTRVWDVDTGRQLLRLASSEKPTDQTIWNLDRSLMLFEPTGAFNRAIWNKNETRIVTASDDGIARLWDASDGVEIRQFKHDSGARWVELNSDETQLLTASSDGTARVWSTVSGEEQIKFNHGLWVNQAVWNDDETQVLTAGCADRWEGFCTVGTVFIWDAIKGTKQISMTGHTNDVYQATLNEDETLVLTASGDNTARLWDSKSGEEILRLEHDERVYKAIWNRDETLILTASHDGTARVWDAKSGSEKLVLSGYARAVYQAIWNDDETEILTTGCDDESQRFDRCVSSSVRIWDADRGIEKLRLSSNNPWVTSAEWNDDETRVLSAGCSQLDGSFRLCNSGLVNIWSVVPSSEAFQFVEDSNINRTEWYTDDQYLLTSGSNKAYIWNATDGTEILRLEGVNQATWSKQTPKILTANGDGTAQIWDIFTKAPILILSHKDVVYRALWNSDETLILTISCDQREETDCKNRTVQIWDTTPDSDPLLKIPGETAVWNDAGTQVLVSSNDGYARVWGTDGQKLFEVEHQRDISWYQEENIFWNTNETLVVAYSGNSVSVWDASGTKKFDLTHKGYGRIQDVDLDSSGDRLLTASEDRTARIWSLSSGEELLRLEHPEQVDQAMWSADENRIFTTSMDGTVRIWNSQTEEEILKFKHRDRIERKTEFWDSVFDVRAEWNSDETLLLTKGCIEIEERQMTDSVFGGSPGFPLPMGPSYSCAEYITRVWQADDGVELFSLPGETTMWNQGETALVSLDGTTAQLYHMKMDDILAQACKQVPRNMKFDEWEIFMGSEPYDLTCPNVSFPPISVQQEIDLLVGANDFEAASDLYQTAKKVDPNIAISPSTLNGLCWQGSKSGFANEVLDACYQAVELAPENVNYRDSRGLSLALTGNFPAAIEDFKYYVDWKKQHEGENAASDRESWIQKLEAGQDPFEDGSVLEALQ